MSSSNTSGLPAGCVSIPVEIIPSSNSNNSNFYDSSYRPFRYDSSFGDFSNSPPWKRPSTSAYSRSHIQPRQTINSAYDRLINESQLNKPLNNGNFYSSYEQSYRRPLYKRSHDTTSLHTSRSSDDLSAPSDFISSNTQSRNTTINSSRFNHGFRADSDFIEPNKYTSPLRRSFDMLNDYSDTYQQNPSEQQSSHRPTYVTKTTINPKVVYSSEYHIPTNHHQSNKSQGILNNSTDQPESPGSQNDESPIRSSQPNSQRPHESDFKVSRDATSTTAGQSTASSNDQQVPSTDASASTTIPIRDPNAIALEKLEQIKQNLADLNEQVDAFTGSTRDDRVYKGLDEQAITMILRCDELTDVSSDIKEKRKEMIRNVQHVVAKLESKVPTSVTVENNSNQLRTESINTNQSSENSTEQQQQGSLNQTEESRTERPT